MSSLKKRLNNKLEKTAESELANDLTIVLKKHIEKKAKEINYTGNIDDAISFVENEVEKDISWMTLIVSISNAINKWGEENKYE